MSTADLERELARWRTPERGVPPSNAVYLSVPEALAYRNRGNLPDDHGRTLRLVLRIESPADVALLDVKRLRYEPDFHDAPEWRRPGSAKVNVVPLRAPEIGAPRTPENWWDDPEMRSLEEEWRARGTAGGVPVPGEWRGFVFKTVAALRSAGKPVTVDAIVASVARWLAPDDVVRLRAALRAAAENP